MDDVSKWWEGGVVNAARMSIVSSNLYVNTLEEQNTNNGAAPRRILEIRGEPPFFENNDEIENILSLEMSTIGMYETNDFWDTQKSLYETRTADSKQQSKIPRHSPRCFMDENHFMSNQIFFCQAQFTTSHLI